MFEVKQHKTIIRDLHKIVSNYSVLLTDEDHDVLYYGTNPYGNRLLGIIMFDDDENSFLRYLHVIVTDYQLHDFLNRKISLRKILETNESFFLIDKKYNGKDLDFNLASINDIPHAFLPLENSYCPDVSKDSSLNYAISLKGNIADLHLAIPEDLGEVNSKFCEFLRSTTEFLRELELNRTIYIEALDAGSFKVNFKIELTGPVQASLYSIDLQKVSDFLSQYFNYAFGKLPEENSDIFKMQSVSSASFQNLEQSFLGLYESAQVVPSQDLEQKLIDTLNYSLENLRKINYSKSFDRIEFLNYTRAGNEVSLGIIDENYVHSIEDKFFKIEEPNKVDVEDVDEKPTEYSIKVYSLNKETGNGWAYVLVENTIEKVSLHLKGLASYENSIFTRNMDKGDIIKIYGIGKRINGKLKDVTYTFGEK